MKQLASIVYCKSSSIQISDWTCIFVPSLKILADESIPCVTLENTYLSLSCFMFKRHWSDQEWNIVVIWTGYLQSLLSWIEGVPKRLDGLLDDKLFSILQILCHLINVNSLSLIPPYFNEKISNNQLGSSMPHSQHQIFLFPFAFLW